MPNSQTKKTKTEVKEKNVKAFNPTKSRVGRIIILILAIGMVLATLIAAIVNMAKTL